MWKITYRVKINRWQTTRCRTVENRGQNIGYVLSKGALPMAFVGVHYGTSSGCCRDVAGFHFVFPGTEVLPRLDDVKAAIETVKV